MTVLPFAPSGVTPQAAFARWQSAAPVRWRNPLAVAATAHVALIAGLLLLARTPAPQPEEPVMVVELPPAPADSPSPAPSSEPAPPQPVPLTPSPLPPMDVPVARIPVPRDATVVPPRVTPQESRPAPAATQPVSQPVQPVAAPSTPGPIGDDPKAKRAEADYFSILAAYLRRNRVYPAEARQARQQGIVTVRFTVDRRGNVSGEGIKRSSGHDILDGATLALMRRVSPLPPMPSSMKKDSITISLPIEYTLTTK